MLNKIIGVTTRINKTDTSTFFRVQRNYIDKLTSRGLNPIILTPQTNLDVIMPLCSGFLIIGGADYDPSYYHETNALNLSQDIDLEMDAFDQKIINYAINIKKPILGICRGHQALAALLGGSLYQDIEQEKLSHPHDDIYHNVVKINNFGLATLLPDEFKVNTYHHQAIKTLAPGFITLYQNHDIIEAIEHKTLPIIGIQWHPERMDTFESDVIFKYFADKIKDYEQNN